MKEFNMIINLLLSYGNAKLYSISTQTSTDTDVWNGRNGAINFFHPRQGPTSQSIYQELTILVKQSCNLVWREPGREQKGGWAAQWVGLKGSASAFHGSIWKRNVRSGSWRGLLECISFSVLGAIVCVASLLAKRVFFLGGGNFSVPF